MSKRKFLLALLVLLLAVPACRFIERGEQTTPRTVPAQPVPASTDVAAPDLPALSVDMVKNAEVLLPVSNTKCTLVDGECRNGDVSAHIGQVFGIGDANGDGVDDIAFIVGENTGGSGTFISLQVAEDNLGEPLVSNALMLGDRVSVSTISIENGLIMLTLLVHGPNDPMCCASQPATQFYRLDDFSGLILVRQATQTPSGAERSIAIESPVNDENVERSVRVVGNFTISPFENNLVYMVYDEMGVPIVVSSTMVSATEMGGPGTFDFTVELPADVTGMVRIEVKDVSAADGSILALDSVAVVVK